MVRPPNAGEDVYLQVARWASNRDDLVFVHKNDVYFMPEGFTETHRITEDTSQYIYNGIPDWIYEEEILAVSTAFWFNDDGTRIAYAQFNDTGVDIQEYPWYGDTIDDSNVYLERVEIKYPKVSPILQFFFPSPTNLINIDFLFIEPARPSESYCPTFCRESSRRWKVYSAPG